MTLSDVIFPFTAIVGQNEMKNALILNVINPAIGGVLIRGEKGTAKSTAVRALADLLPERNVSKCPFHCDITRKKEVCPYCLEELEAGRTPETEPVKMRVVELPLSATEDRVAGTLDLEYAIKTGKKKFEPGVLAKANGNILYVDEVNLLDDHIVDLLLDSAAMGRGTVPVRAGRATRVGSAVRLLPQCGKEASAGVGGYARQGTRTRFLARAPRQRHGPLLHLRVPEGRSLQGGAVHVRHVCEPSMGSAQGRTPQGRETRSRRGTGHQVLD